MKNLLLWLSIVITSPAMAFWGGFDADKIADTQEEAYQAAKACENSAYMDACADFADLYGKVFKMLEDNKEDIADGYKNGDREVEKILNRMDRLTRFAKSL